MVAVEAVDVTELVADVVVTVVEVKLEVIPENRQLLLSRVDFLLLASRHRS